MGASNTGTKPVQEPEVSGTASLKAGGSQIFRDRVAVVAGNKEFLAAVSQRFQKSCDYLIAVDTRIAPALFAN